MDTVKTSNLGGGGRGEHEDTRQTEKSTKILIGSSIAEVIGGVLAAILGILDLTEVASISVISIAITIIL